MQSMGDIHMKLVRLATLTLCLFSSSCTYWRASQENFHRVNADNQVYNEYINHTTYPVTSSVDYCRKVNGIPNRGSMSNYGSVIEECRGGSYDDTVEELPRRMYSAPQQKSAKQEKKEK